MTRSSASKTNDPEMAYDLLQLFSTAKIFSESASVSISDSHKVYFAQAYCHRVVSGWWDKIAGAESNFPLRDLFQPIPHVDLPRAAESTADRIAFLLANLDSEDASYKIGEIYTCMLPSSFRSRFGVYYTPPQLVQRLIDQATKAGTDWAKCKVLDPACGGGAFLAPVARRILLALPNVTPAILVKNISNRLRGYEIDHFAAWLSQVTVDSVMLDTCRKAKRRLPVLVTVCNSLQRSATGDKYQLVIGNPPYGRIKLSTEERERYQRSLFGHANLYGMFTDLALHHVHSGGVIAYVTPTSFLGGEYFKKLRALLGDKVTPATVDFVAARKGVFADVLQETLLTTYRQGSSSKTARVYEVHPANGRGLDITETGVFLMPNEPSQPWLLPRTPEQASLIVRLQSLSHRLVDWGYKVSTGPLVWNRHKEKLRNQPGNGRFPLIWAEAVTADGTFVFRAERRNHKPYFEPEEGDDWLITSNSCVLLQRTTAKEQKRRLIAAAMPESFLTKHKSVVVENHLNMLRPLTIKPRVSPNVLAAFLNSEAADRAFRCVSGSVAVSAYELEALPLPDPNDLSVLVDLVSRHDNRLSIEAECDRLYGEVNSKLS